MRKKKINWKRNKFEIGFGVVPCEPTANLCIFPLFEIDVWTELILLYSNFYSVHKRM